MAVAITVMVLVLLAMIGSLWWLLPTPAERRRMKLRQLAFSHGLKVREARDEMAEWQIDVTERGVLMEYYLFREEAKGGRWDIVRPGGISIPQKESQRLEASHPAMALVEWEKLPADLLMWCRRDQKYSFFWFEGCDAEGLMGAIDTLKKLSQY